MKDEFHEFPPDPASQKSVTDWLMQVISGKKPIELNLNGNAQEEKAAKPAATKMAAASAAAPIETSAAAAVVDVLREGSSTIEPERIEPESADVFRHPEAAVVEPEEDVVTVADISRDVPAQIFEPAQSEAVSIEEIFLPRDFEPEPMPEPPAAATAPEAQVEPAAVEAEIPEPMANAIATEPAVDSVPEAAMESHAAAMESAPPSEPIAAAEVSDEPAPEVEAALVNAAIAHEATIVEPEATAAPKILEASQGATAATEPALAQENVWARPDLWRDTARAEGAPLADEDPAAAREAERTYRDEGRYPDERLYPEMGAPREMDALREMEKDGPESWNSAWKTLLRLGSVLPWIARALPMLEAGAANEPPPAALSQEVRREVASIRQVQYEIRTTVQDQALQLKRVEEQLGRIRESLKTPEYDELAESVKSSAKLLRMAGIGLGGLLVILILMVAVLLAHGR